MSLYYTPWTPLMSELGGQWWPGVVHCRLLQLAASPKLLVGQIFPGSFQDGKAEVAP